MEDKLTITEGKRNRRERRLEETDIKWHFPYIGTYIFGGLTYNISHNDYHKEYESKMYQQYAVNKDIKGVDENLDMNTEQFWRTFFWSNSENKSEINVRDEGPCIVWVAQTMRNGFSFQKYLNTST